ncbi:MAG: hypothetical protein V9F03_13530 [Microthrixaceae bacterium]
MGQPVTVIEKPSSTPGVVRFETNRVLTGTEHARYLPSEPVEGRRPADELARRLFEVGGIDSITMMANVITVNLSKGATSQGMKEVIESLYTYYTPGVRVPTPADFGYVES